MATRLIVFFVAAVMIRLTAAGQNPPSIDVCSMQLKVCDRFIVEHTSSEFGEGHSLTEVVNVSDRETHLKLTFTTNAQTSAQGAFMPKRTTVLNIKTVIDEYGKFQERRATGSTRSEAYQAYGRIIPEYQTSIVNTVTAADHNASALVGDSIEWKECLGKLPIGSSDSAESITETQLPNGKKISQTMKSSYRVTAPKEVPSGLIEIPSKLVTLEYDMGGGDLSPVPSGIRRTFFSEQGLLLAQEEISTFSRLDPSKMTSGRMSQPGASLPMEKRRREVSLRLLSRTTDDQSCRVFSYVASTTEKAVE